MLGAHADWQESLRRSLYPRLHDPLTNLGAALGVPLYATGHVGFNQCVGVLDEDEEAIEQELDDAGAVRNPIACFKYLPDGRPSEGSWVVRHDAAPKLVARGMQLHFTMFERHDGKPGRELYCHYEDDWRKNALGHLRGTRFSVSKGVRRGRRFVNTRTFLALHH